MSKKVESIPIPESVKVKLQQLGVEEKDIDNKTAISFSLLQQALKGNVSAINTMFKMFPAEDDEEEIKVKNITNEIKAEEKKLQKIINKLPKEQQEANQEFIHQLSFMQVQIRDLSNDIAIHGVKEKYKNGANQWGFKDRTEVKTYNNMFKNYQGAIKQLNELLNNAGIAYNDGFDDDELY